MGFDISASTGTSNAMAFQALIKPFIGAGALNLPLISSYGLFQFSILLILLTGVASYCIFRLTDCSEIIMHAESRLVMLRRKLTQLRLQSTIIDPDDLKLFDQVPQFDDSHIEDEDRAQVTLPSFTEIGAVAFGPFGAALVDFCIVITQIGACCAYVIFISKSLFELTGVMQQIWSGLLILPLILLSFVRDMTALAPMASFGNLVYLYAIVVMVYQGLEHCCVPVQDIPLVDIPTLPLVFGSLSFALEGIVLVLPVKQRMADPNSFNSIMSYAMLTIFAVYFLLGNIGAIFYGAETQSPITSNLTPGFLADSVKVSLCIALFFTYAIQIFPAAIFFDRLLDRFWFHFDFIQLRQDAVEEELSKLLGATTPRVSYASIRNRSNSSASSVVSFPLSSSTPTHLPSLSLNSANTPGKTQFSFALNDKSNTKFKKTRNDKQTILARANQVNSETSPANDEDFATNYSKTHSLPPQIYLSTSSPTQQLSTTQFQRINDQGNNSFNPAPQPVTLQLDSGHIITTNRPNPTHHNNASNFNAADHRRDPIEIQSLPHLAPHSHNLPTPRTRSSSIASNLTTQSHNHQHQQNQPQTIFTNEDLVPQEQRYQRILLQNIHRSIAVLLTVFVAMLFPEFSLVVALFGAFTNALLAYILPAAFYLSIVSSTHFYGVDWFPFDRSGNKTQPLPHHFGPKRRYISNGYVYNTGPVDHDDDDDGVTFGTSTLEKEHKDDVLNGPLDENCPLLPVSTTTNPQNKLTSTLYTNSAGDSPTKANGTVLPKPKFSKPFLARISIISFPIAVVVLGTVASAIGVSAALADLLTTNV